MTELSEISKNYKITKCQSSAKLYNSEVLENYRIPMYPKVIKFQFSQKSSNSTLLQNYKMIIRTCRDGDSFNYPICYGAIEGTLNTSYVQKAESTLDSFDGLITRRLYDISDTTCFNISDTT